MAIIKIHKKTRFVVVDNKLARNRFLTLKAKGLMLYLLSLPADKNITLKELEKHIIEGKDSLRNAVIELMAEGYITRKKYRNEKGLFQTEYTVYEYPQETNRVGLSDTDKPTRNNRNGLPDADNPHSRSKESVKKKEEKSSSPLPEIKKQLSEIGLSGNEIEEILTGIDDDDKCNIILEKIKLVKVIILTGTVKNPVGYTIKTIKNINFDKPDILKIIEAEKRAEKDKKRKAELELIRQEKEKYKRDMEATEQDLPKIHKVVENTLEKLRSGKKRRKVAGGLK